VLGDVNIQIPDNETSSGEQQSRDSINDKKRKERNPLH